MLALFEAANDGTGRLGYWTSHDNITVHEWHMLGQVEASIAILVDRVGEPSTECFMNAFFVSLAILVHNIRGLDGDSVPVLFRLFNVERSQFFTSLIDKQLTSDRLALKGLVVFQGMGEVVLEAVQILLPHYAATKPIFLKSKGLATGVENYTKGALEKIGKSASYYLTGILMSV